MLFAERHRLILFLSEASLLPIVMPLHEVSQLLPHFRSRLAEFLVHLGVNEHDISTELSEMAQAVIATTANRSVLGSMNDFSQSAKVYLRVHRDFSMLGLEAWLAETPARPLAYRSPNQVAPELLAYASSR